MKLLPNSSLRRLVGPICLCLALALPGAAAANDAEGRYAVDGAGRSTCGDFIKAGDESPERVRRYAGWLNGYMSGLNHRLPETYDLTPWQSIELLLAKMRAYCTQNPDVLFAAGTNELIRALYPQRLAEKSELARIDVDGAAVFVYTALIPRIHAALTEQGYSAGDDDSSYSDAMGAAVRAFQTERSLKVTGLPDQVTMNALFP